MSTETKAAPIEQDSGHTCATAPAPKALSFRWNAIWSVIGNVVYAGSRWSLLAILAKLGSSEQVGVFVLGVALVSPIVMFSQMQLRTVLVTDARERFGFGEYFLLRLLGTIIAAFVLAIIASWGYERTIAHSIIAIGVAYCIESLADIFYGKFQLCNRMDIIAVSQALRGVSTVAGLALGIAWSSNVFWGIVGIALSSAGVLLLYDLPVIRVLRTQGGGISHREGVLQAPVRSRPTVGRLYQLTLISLPLGLTTTLVTLNTSLIRLFLEAHAGSAQLGSYAVAASLVQIVGTFVVAVFGAALPRLASYFDRRDKNAFRSLFGKLLALNLLGGAALFLTGLLAGKEIIRVLFREEYTRNFDVTLWLLAAGALGYVGTMLGATLSAARRFSLQLALATTVTSGTALACWYLVPSFGLMGAAYATMVSMVVQIVIFAVAVWGVSRSTFLG